MKTLIGGGLADDNLYALDLRAGEDSATWRVIIMIFQCYWPII